MELSTNVTLPSLLPLSEQEITADFGNHFWATVESPAVVPADAIPRTAVPATASSSNTYFPTLHTIASICSRLLWAASTEL